MNLAQQKCVPCAGGMSSLSSDEAQRRLIDVPGWELTDDATRIERRFSFRNFLEAWAFADQVARTADQEGHHPDISFGWGYCVVSFFTHTIHGLHENDFIMAAKVNDIVNDPAMSMVGAGTD